MFVAINIALLGLTSPVREHFCSRTIRLDRAAGGTQRVMLRGYNPLASPSSVAKECGPLFC